MNDIEQNLLLAAECMERAAAVHRLEKFFTETTADIPLRARQLVAARIEMCRQGLTRRAALACHEAAAKAEEQLSQEAEDSDE